MRGLRTLLSAVGFLSIACSPVLAQSLVVETRTGATLESSNTYSSGASFTIPLTSTTNRINMYSTGGLADIGAITFSGSTSASLVDVIIGSGALNEDRNANLSNAADDWGGVSFPFNGRLSGAIAGNLTGSINPHSIVRFEAHGQVSGAITASLASGTAIGYLQLGSTTSAGTISASGTGGADIIKIEVESSGSAILGAIWAPSGKIGIIETPGDISISSGGIQARDGIDNIDARNVDAAIDAAANGGSGNLCASGPMARAEGRSPARFMRTISASTTSKIPSRSPPRWSAPRSSSTATSMSESPSRAAAILATLCSTRSRSAASSTAISNDEADIRLHISATHSIGSLTVAEDVTATWITAAEIGEFSVGGDFVYSVLQVDPETIFVGGRHGSRFVSC